MHAFRSYFDSVQFLEEAPIKHQLLYFALFVGETIAQLTDVAALDHPESDGQITIFTDKTGVVKAARLLLSSVTKVLVLADRIVIKQIITSRNKVFKIWL